MESQKKKILFIGEDVTLAHLSRLLFLADTLDANRYEIHLAHNGKYRQFTEPYGWEEHHIPGISQETFRVRTGKVMPLFTVDEMREMVSAEELLFADVKPDLIVVDYLRYSAVLLAEKMRIPFFTVIDPHWSPCSTEEFPIPEHPLVDLVGITAARTLFPLLKPIFLWIHRRNLDAMRKEVGLQTLSSFKEHAVTGTEILYAGTPSIGPTEQLPPHHRYIGPICWEPPMELPERLRNLPTDRPIVYVSFGSSGDVSMLGKIVTALRKLRLSGVITTAGRIDITETDHLFVEKFLPASDIIARASLVIGNGGSPLVYQALSAGVPVLGIPSNIDQYFTMESVERAGVGKLLRPKYVTEPVLKAAITKLLGDREIRNNVEAARREIGTYDTRTIFPTLVGTYVN